MNAQNVVSNHQLVINDFRFSSYYTVLLFDIHVGFLPL